VCGFSSGGSSSGQHSLESEYNVEMVPSILACLGPISSARPGGDTRFLYFAGALFTCSIVWHVLREWARTKQIREFSARRSLTYLGNAVPRSFPLRRAEAFKWGRSVRRTFVGSNASKDLVVFDCTIGYGRGRRARTVVAARGQSGGFGWAQFGPGLLTEEVAEWSIVYGSNRLMSIEEIEALVSAFSAPTQPAS
jgi:hypothetical protein